MSVVGERSDWSDSLFEREKSSKGNGRRKEEGG